MFLAVGAAHLPGDSGVIKLLQKRGFKVEPVFSKKKTYVFYLYKVTYKEEENESRSYLGIVGGYDLKGKNPEYLQYLAGIITSEEFDANRVGVQFDSFVKQEEEEE